jgi:hypothetical protein
MQSGYVMKGSDEVIFELRTKVVCVRRDSDEIFELRMQFVGVRKDSDEILRV